MSLGLPAHIEAKISPEPNTGCWLWEAGQSQGYGYIWRGNKMERAHRVVYTLLRGQIPEGLELDHLCRMRCCVNPDHLEAVTTRTNQLRSTGQGALNARKTHCPKGHDLAEAYIRNDNGGRQCSTCAKAWALRYQRRHK